MRSKRATIVGIIVGAVLLAALAGYAIGLPKVEGTLPTLPDRLGGSFVAISTVTPEQFSSSLGVDQQTATQIAQGFADNARDKDASGASHLSDLYGADVTVRTYLDVSKINRMRQRELPPELAVTVARTGSTGLVFPSGPLGSDLDGTHYVLKEIDGYQCGGTYADPQQATSSTPATATTYGTTECRTSQGGLTYDIYGSDISPEDAAGYLHDLVEGA